MYRPLVFLTAIALGSVAQGATLDFDDLGLVNYAPIPSGYGSVAGEVAIDNRTRVGFGNANIYENHVELWDTGYGNPSMFRNVFSSANGYVGEFQFTPAADKAVNLIAFDAASYSGGPRRTASFYIYDAAWNTLWSSINTVIEGAPLTISPNITHAGTIYFQWGTDWNVGIDNIQFRITDVNGPQVVPVPAALPLLATALGGLVIAARRRRV